MLCVKRPSAEKGEAVFCSGKRNFIRATAFAAAILGLLLLVLRVL